MKIVSLVLSLVLLTLLIGCGEERPFPEAPVGYDEWDLEEVIVERKVRIELWEYETIRRVNSIEKMIKDLKLFVRATMP